LESLESQNLRRDNVFENADETQWCRARRGKVKVEAFGIWKIFQSLGRKRKLKGRAQLPSNQAEGKIWTIEVSRSDNNRREHRRREDLEL
jgi:hypothetical protein